MASLFASLTRALRSTLAGKRPATTTRPATTGGPATTLRPDRGEQVARGQAYPGDFVGDLSPVYAPHPDGRPDPGEIVWTWVPFEEDHSQGKDRPVLLIARDPQLAAWLLALPLTSKDHDLDAEQEHRSGRDWVDIGSGSWDRRGRPSEVRVNRIVRVAEATVRREGAVLDPQIFAAVAEAVRLRRPRR